MNLTGILAIALAIAIAAGAVLYNLWDGADERADTAEAALTQVKENERVTIKYIDRKVEVIRNVPVIRRQLVRVCDEAVSGPRDSPSAAQPEAGHGVLDALGTEVGDCLAESAQLHALIEVLRPQVQ